MSRVKKVQSVAPQQPSQEQFKLIRNSLKNTAHSKYMEFIDLIKKLPLQPESFNNAFLFLDTGWLWLEVAIENAPIATTPAPNPIASPEKKTRKKRSPNIKKDKKDKK